MLHVLRKAMNMFQVHNPTNAHKYTYHTRCTDDDTSQELSRALPLQDSDLWETVGRDALFVRMKSRLHGVPLHSVSLQRGRPISTYSRHISSL